MKKILIAISVILLGTVITYLVNSIAKTGLQLAEAPNKNDLPNIKIIKGDGTFQEAKQLQGKIILIIYFTDCDHCQREATEISNNLKSFENYNLWFLSTDAFPNIEKFSVDYKLANRPNVNFARIQSQDVYTNFGPIPTPSVYIYTETKRLVRAIKGETPIGDILKYL